MKKNLQGKITFTLKELELYFLTPLTLCPLRWGGLAFIFLGGAMAQKRPIGRGQTVVGCGHFEKPKFSAIVIGGMMFQLINPIVKEESLQN